MKKVLTLFLSLSLLAQSQVNSSKISGKIILDSTWQSTIFLSEIKSFNHLYKMSNQMIIAEAKIDSQGSFSFNTSYLPKEDRLYRLHVSKKGSPKASLIIGGKNENYTIINYNSKSSLKLKPDSNSYLFNSIIYNLGSKNYTIQEIHKLLRNIDSIEYNDSQIKREFIVDATNQSLRHIADTTQNSLVSLYAIYASNFKTNATNFTSYYLKYIEKWNNEDSNYYKEFKSDLNLDVNTSKESNSKYYFFALVTFICGFFMSKLYYNSRKSSKIKSLSVQERKIFKSIKEGKSNKEISEDYNIGINTVKSHIKNIYSKLNLKSRKDAINY